MAQRIETAIEERPLRELTLLADNARYMDKKEFDLLVSNIKNDGCLTSLPLVYDGDVPGEIISGNHRVQAAIQAGIETAKVIVIKSAISHDQKVALQLSHNSITGKDDPNLLRALYDSIGNLDFKMYSGITDEMFKVDELTLAAMTFEAPKEEEVILHFLQGDKEIFCEALEKIKRKSKRLHLIASMDDFNSLFDVVFAVKSELNILNTTEAIKAVVQLAQERLEQLGGEGA
ncbi:ParB N-terminal domain-containing protein [Neisseria shayeganii]|uniref:ParB N-terminal domain-containing protein n=1 Tax=Neisseria shayeganii TaxID=607712 RepID=A0A7D7NCC5_9NEIS|nr:ParB N-terminal domain-containing protein [Neisseria shayeganii]QMT41255.1 ParB N-terminal domain-containing protein [Neisseria shayeganii]